MKINSHSQTLQLILPDEQALLDFAAKLAQTVADDRLLFYLYGNLGVGKTTLVRGFLRQFGYLGAVKSPTFTLVEPYTLTQNNLQQLSVFHFDLYRLGDAEELEYMGMQDYLDGRSMVFIEWPEKGEGFLNQADINISLDYAEKGRYLSIDGISAPGKNYVSRLRLLLS